MRWLRYLGGILIIFVSIVAAMLLAAVNVTYTARTVGKLYAERSAPDRTAAACLDKKDGCDLAKSAPIAGLTEYRRCGGVVSAARIKGQPLACSEQWATDLLLRDWSNPGGSAYRQLRRGCRTHDLCYVHGNATYGIDRAQCDSEFLAENLRECWMIYNSEAKVNWEAERFGEKFAQTEKGRKPWYSRWFGIDRDEFRKACQARAAIAYLAVRVGGQELFERHEGVACDYEGGPHAARDQVASGRFLGGTRDYVVSLSLAGKQNALIVRLLSFGPDGQSRDEADRLVFSPDTVLVGDREWTCSWRHTSDGAYREDCPEWLGPSAFKSAANWLRFAPIVVDSDGDGKDELVIPSLVADFGLVFTHIQVKREGDTARFEAPLAYLGAARMERADTERECEFEFADCRQSGSPPKLLSSEAADQNAGYQFAVAKSADAACPPLGNPNGQDILLISAFSDFPENPNSDVSKIGGWDSDYVLRRFTFDPHSRRWQMRRDRFNNDFHRMAGCSIREGRDQFQTHSRLQYPPLIVRLPPVPEAKLAKVNPPACAYEERLAVISRDKCPTSTPVARAGGLNDVDLMLYQPKPRQLYDLASDAEQRKRYPKGNYDELRMAEVHWKPILLPETADPAVTSRAAREHGIVMVGAYIGGTRLIGRGGDDIQRVGHHPVIAVVRVNQILPLNQKGFDRYADTMGRVPDLYGVFKSSKSKSAELNDSERTSNLWDPKRYGPVSIYFQIPSVLTSFDAKGGKGVSLALFSNHALWQGPPPQKVPDWYRALSSFMTGLFGLEPLSKHLSEPLPIKEGIFRLMIVPIWFEDPDKEWAQPGMIDCPVDAIKGASAKPAAGVADDPFFLRRQPVLAGKFFDTGTGGSLAVAWRDENGEIRLTALHFTDGKWTFGNKECARPAGMESGELFRLRIN